MKNTPQLIAHRQSIHAFCTMKISLLHKSDECECEFQVGIRIAQTAGERDSNMENFYGPFFPDEFMNGENHNPYQVRISDVEAVWLVERTFHTPIAELLTYGADLRELVEYTTTDKTVCELSYELQCCVYDLFPRWYIAQTPFRNEIYPDIIDVDWQIWLKHWEQLGRFFEDKGG
jgi:hypothetical protein